MARRVQLAVAATAAVALGLTGCGSPSSNNKESGKGDTGTINTAVQGIDRNAKGPAPEIAGAHKGGTLTVYSQSTPNTLDPTNIYYVDSNEIGKLLFRTPTQYDVRQGKPVLVPDLTDLGTVSSDNLTWTFKLQPNIKYADGTPVAVDDLAYAVKRSFAHDVYDAGPTYQLIYFKDGDKYKGPYKSGDTYAGVETQGTDTLIIHLAKPFPDLPYYLTFPAFTPIPKAKDTKQNYQNNPMITGPYMYDVFTPGTELKLKKNPNWDPNTDPARHQYVDAWDFKWGQDDVKTQTQVLNSSGPDASAINYMNIDASLVQQITAKQDQLVQGQSPCTRVWQMDTRKIPLEVRKALATGWDYDSVWTAYGFNPYTAERASTVIPPSIPGYTKYPALPGLSGAGKGDPAAAKQQLQAAGKLGFEISYYYDNTKPIPQQVSQAISNSLTASGFKVKAIGVSTADLRKKTGDYDAPVNFAQSPRGWCSDWPTGNSWFPVLFQTHSISDGQSWGMLSDKALDAEIDSIAALPSDQASAKWGALDQKIMGMYVAIPMDYEKMALVKGTNVGAVQGDATVGMPLFQSMFLKS
ncbi:ABC transporter substrate-binding protein [Actinoplanes sp. KI2]|uniref:ABC transporter substrate-binding protein n=1 Tax=Actinoplanes sp. KI2 TaxID=2983315 RepID=UPI0021D5D755|nr:ABC transporter substrate-binding protein [Actinoplanes sp. KI2]MCU7728533.1 ABC transporter substrate-binding protein [Actinoplanes sp. KI2]